MMVQRSSIPRPFSGCAGQGRGFTLLEVLVVVAVIALLAAILLPSLRNARTQARRTLCLSNLHQIAVALYTYQADHKGKAPREWGVDLGTDGMALWAGRPVRLGMLYPRYVGKNENVFYCPDAQRNRLLGKGGKGETGTPLYPWSNWGQPGTWAYGSYDYRPRYAPSTSEYIAVDFDKNPPSTSIAADAFAGYLDGYGPAPAHSPVEDQPRMLYYNVASIDGSAGRMRDFIYRSPVPPFSNEFRTRAAAPAQQDPYTPNHVPGGPPPMTLPREYTGLSSAFNEALPKDPAARNDVLRTTAHIDRGWTFFDTR